MFIFRFKSMSDGKWHVGRNLPPFALLTETEATNLFILYQNTWGTSSARLW